MIYLVVDEYQYDGGYCIDSAYADSTHALIRQQKLRHEASKKMRNLKLKESSKIVRLEAIRIMELNVL